MAASMVGALIIQTMRTTLYSKGIPPEIMLVVNALIVIVICSLQSDRVKKFVERLHTSTGVQS